MRKKNNQGRRQGDNFQERSDTDDIKSQHS